MILESAAVTLQANIVGIIAIIAAVTSFILGYGIIIKNLKKINLIENESITFREHLMALLFASLFAGVIMTLLNLLYGVWEPTIVEKGVAIIPPSYILMILLAFLFIYPVYNAFVLGKPTSDATSDLDKWIESKFLNKYSGPWAYIMSFIVFILQYFGPVLIIYYLLVNFVDLGEDPLIKIVYLIFLFYPLTFLNYFTASGSVATIIGTTYSNKHKLDPREERYLVKKPKVLGLFSKLVAFIKILIAWVPFLLGFYTIYNAFMGIINPENLQNDEGNPFTPILFLTILVQVLMGIYGFFKKYWSKKSKTKTIDYLFSLWIFISIGISLLIDFSSFEEGRKLTTVICGDYPFLIELQHLFENSQILFPLLSIKGFIMVFYGGMLLLKKNSDFQADLKLNACNGSYKLNDITEIKEKKQAGQDVVVRAIEVKDIDVLTKSLFLLPIYNKYGFDINEPVRRKAAQYIYLSCFEDEKLAEQVIDVIFKNTFEKDKIMKDATLLGKIFEGIDKALISLHLKSKMESTYISEEAVDTVLGKLGKRYPNFVVNRLVEKIDTTNSIGRRLIFDAIGDIGESEANLDKILTKIKPYMSDKSLLNRNNVNASIVEMVTEGETNNESFVNKNLDFLYSVIDENMGNVEVLESTMSTLLELTAKIPDRINLEKIYPLIEFCDENAQEHLNDKNYMQYLDFIQQYAVSIIARCIYYNPSNFPLERMKQLATSSRNFVRYVATDAIGNYILIDKPEVNNILGEQGRIDILSALLKMSIYDDDEDVREMAAESIAEFMILQGDKKTQYVNLHVDGVSIKPLDYVLEKLNSNDPNIIERASETLKGLAPVFDDNIVNTLHNKILHENLEVRRDSLETLGLLKSELHKDVSIELIVNQTNHKNDLVRAKACYALGMIAPSRPDDIDENDLFERLDDEVLEVRMEAIFALGKLGAARKNPVAIIQKLIRNFFTIDRSAHSNVSEVELYVESLGTIGNVHPANEIVITLQNALMGDTNVYAKDIVARGLYLIGEGLIKSGGKTEEYIKDNVFFQIVEWMGFANKIHYSIGNIVMILIEAMQLKAIPEIVMDEISDALQDLLPAFLFDDNKDNDRILETIKELLSQAYYSNYNDEILETMDRIESLISFKKYFSQKDEDTRFFSMFFAKNYTPDGKQFYDQGKLFLLKKEDPKYLDYALKSFEAAIDLSPHEYYTPESNLEIGKIYVFKRDYNKADLHLNDALETFASLDDIEKMKICQEYIQKMNELKSQQ